MKIVKDIPDLRIFLTSVHVPGTSLGFVPTMGALHEGHLSLAKESIKNNDITVCSIFVNPTQFNNPDDLLHYPKSPEEDIRMLEEIGCDAVFMPDNQMMYPEPAVISFNIGYLDTILEGKFRKGHFNGVALIVSKLFNIVRPDNAYFGQKDLQQFVILNRLVKDLSYPINMVRMPIVREPDGLAMSSRNRRLNKEERKNALAFYQALKLAQENLQSGQTVNNTKSEVADFFQKQNKVKLEYFEIVDAETLLDVKEPFGGREVALVIAGYVGEVRLIDNFIIRI